MFLAAVLGDVVATTKHGDLADRKLMLVQPLDGEGRAAGRAVIAVDAAQAGLGDRVLVADEGNSAAQVLMRPRGAVRTVIVGIVDTVTRE